MDHYLDQVIGGRSLCFYACFLMFSVAVKCFILRSVHPCYQMLALDMSAAFVAYGCSFCHGYIANVYGPPAYLVALISVGMLQRIVFFGSANPLPHVIKLVECSSPCDKDLALWRIGAIMVGGIIAHPFAKLLWVGLMPDVQSCALEQLHCMMPTPTGRPPLFVPLAAGIEFLGSFIICAMYTGTTVCASIDAYELWTKFFLGCLFNCLDSGYIAIHLNPALAGSMLFGCSYDDVIRALCVYWLAPLLAAIAFACSCTCSWPAPCFTLTCCPPPPVPPNAYPRTCPAPPTPPRPCPAPPPPCPPNPPQPRSPAPPNAYLRTCPAPPAPPRPCSAPPPPCPPEPPRPWSPSRPNAYPGMCQAPTTSPEPPCPRPCPPAPFQSSWPPPPCPKPCPPPPSSKPCFPSPCPPPCSQPCPQPCSPPSIQGCPPPYAPVSPPARIPPPFSPNGPQLNQDGYSPNGRGLGGPGAGPRPCDPKGQITAQMRQLNKGAQKEVNYVICIPPMCSEKGVRLQHKFVVDKDDKKDAGGGATAKGDGGNGNGSGSGSGSASGSYHSADREETSSKNTSTATGSLVGQNLSQSAQELSRSYNNRYISKRSSKSETRNSISKKNANDSNANIGNRKQLSAAAEPYTNAAARGPLATASGSGPLDIRLRDTRVDSDGWQNLIPTARQRRSSANSGRTAGEPFPSSETSD